MLTFFLLVLKLCEEVVVTYIMIYKCYYLYIYF